VPPTAIRCRFLEKASFAVRQTGRKNRFMKNQMQPILKQRLLAGFPITRVQ